ncbi:hypothetical protein LTS18_001542, partial [Coniosporium uncinatum]
MTPLLPPLPSPTSFPRSVSEIWEEGEQRALRRNLMPAPLSIPSLPAPSPSPSPSRASDATLLNLYTAYFGDGSLLDHPIASPLFPDGLFDSQSLLNGRSDSPTIGTITVASMPASVAPTSTTSKGPWTNRIPSHRPSSQKRCPPPPPPARLSTTFTHSPEQQPMKPSKPTGKRIRSQQPNPLAISATCGLSIDYKQNSPLPAIPSPPTTPTSPSTPTKSSSPTSPSKPPRPITGYRLPRKPLPPAKTPPPVPPKRNPHGRKPSYPPRTHTTPQFSLFPPSPPSS